MKEQEIHQALVNLQIISDHTYQSIQYLMSQTDVNFDQLKVLHKKLKVIVALAAETDICVKNSLSRCCPECGCKDIFIDWDAGIGKCQTKDCRHCWSVRSGIGVDGAYKLT